MDNTKIISLGVLAYVVTKIAQENADRVRYSYKCERPLYDVLHNTIPNLKRYEVFVDVVPLLLVVAVLYLYMYDNFDEKLFRDTITNISILMILRALVFSLTIIPSSFCSRGGKSNAIGGCHDCIYSGHTVATLILAYSVYQHNPQYQTALTMYCILGSLLIIGTRSHYTIDVIIAYIVVYGFLK